MQSLDSRLKEKNKKSILLKYIRTRVSKKKDKDAIIVIAGERGSTKSGVAITLGYLLDRGKNGKCRFYLPEKFFPEGFELKEGEKLPRVIFKPTDFLKLIQKLPKGSVLVWDETGVEGDARDFQTKKNKLLKRTMETIRSRNLIIILTAPTLASYDVGFRRSNTIYIECHGATKSPTNKLAGIAKVYRAQTNPRSGKTYYKLLKFKDKSSPILRIIKRFYIGKPPAHLEDPYKRYKELFLTKLYASYIEELDSTDYLDDKTDIINHEQFDTQVEEVLASLRRYYNFKKKRFVPAALKHGLKLKSGWEARQLREYLEFQVTRGKITIPELTTAEPKKKPKIV